MGAPAWFSAPDQGQGRGKNEGRETIWVGPERRFVPPQEEGCKGETYFCVLFVEAMAQPGGGGGSRRQARPVEGSRTLARGGGSWDCCIPQSPPVPLQPYTLPLLPSEQTGIF